MAVSDVAALSGAILRIASTIQNLGNGWYIANQEWDDFPRKVELLSTKHKFWLAEFAKFGMLSDAALIGTLRTAKLLLKAEEAKLLKRGDKAKRCRGTGCWAKWSMTAFPAQVGLSIHSVISAFDDIQALLKNEEEGAAALGKRERGMAFALPFSEDPRYVPLKATEKAIRDALVSADYAVVLLHGGPGKGKSTLARAIALEYQRAAKGAGLFEGVFYLECGPQAKISEIQFTLLQGLGVALDPQEEAGTDSVFPKRLQGRLRDRKLLIIFDDVWDGGLLQGMVNLCGNGIKCLVTSQRGDLCRGLHCSSIPITIEDVHLEDARKILAKHVGFVDHVIPQHLEEIVDEVIQETERNPLAIAIIGGSIDTRRSLELDTWEDASNKLVVTLNADSPTYIINIKYPRSLWATMERSFKSLEKGAQSVLILVDMCDGLSVPEEVVELLYWSTRLPEDPTDFAKLRQDLESREMVKIAIVSEEMKIASVSEAPRKQRAWSIHSLQKKFIEGVGADIRESIVASLRGLSSTTTRSQVELQTVRGFSLSEEDVHILISLVALYFDQQFKEPALMAALKMDIPSHKFTNLRRSAIEPVIRLLGQPISKRWTRQLRTSAKQVFIGYIWRDTLEDNDVSDLLASPISNLAMMSVLGDIATLGETTLLDEKLHNYTNVLIDLVGNGNNGEGSTSSLRKAAGQALWYLCKNKACRAFIVAKLPRVLDTLIRQLLTNAYPEFARGWSSTTLRVLCEAEDVSVEEAIVQHPGFLACLMQLLSTENTGSSTLRRNAIYLVGRLADGHNDIKLKLVKTGVLLEELVKVLLENDNAILQQNAIAILALLAAGVEEVKVNMLKKIHEIPKAMDGLSRLLAQHIDPMTQACAAIVLTSLYPSEGNAAQLYSGLAFLGRGYANLLSGNYEASLPDLDKALETQPFPTLSCRSFVLAKLGNYQGALLDSNKVLEIQYTPGNLQERGVLKRMMGDLRGALVDLDKGLEIKTDNYERLKHRGYVKFLMNDKVGASADAEWALRIKPSHVDDPGYGRGCLGASSVEYMGYTLR